MKQSVIAVLLILLSATAFGEELKIEHLNAQEARYLGTHPELSQEIEQEAAEQILRFRDVAAYTSPDDPMYQKELIELSAMIKTQVREHMEQEGIKVETETMGSDEPTDASDDTGWQLPIK